MTQSDIINNNFSKAFECIKCSNAYDTGEVLSEEKLFKQISERKHSTFDKSKFTVVGSPTITDDGIASGFSNSNYSKADVSITPVNRLVFKSRITYNTLGNTSTYPQAKVFWGTNYNNWRLTTDNGNAIRFVSNDLGAMSLYIGTMADGDIIDTDLIITTTSITINAIHNGAKFTKTESKNVTFGLISGLSFGTTIEGSLYFFTGSIDLSHFSITVDGKEVFSGNKTGLDVINDVEIPYTLSKTGSKIVDGGYRDRVIELYEQEGQADYFTIDEVNKNFTLPMGEIYGMAVRKDLSNLSEVGEKHFLNKSQITNCLLEVPQRIKYTLADGTLTIKAGSVVIVPYGTENLTAQYPKGTKFSKDYFKVADTQFVDGKFFVWAELIEDKTLPITTSSSAYKKAPVSLNFSANTESSVFGYANSQASGTETGTVASTLYYQTNNNTYLYENTGTEYMSFPLLQINHTANSGIVTIDQVFNGFGYIGSTVWVDKGVKYLACNGRNADGSLNNIEYVTTSVKIRTNPIGANLTYFRLMKNGQLIAMGSKKYFEQEEQPTSTYALWYKPSENIMYYCGSDGVWTDDPWDSIYVITATANSTGKITSFQPKLPFRAVDYSDIWYDSSTQTLHIGG